MQILSDDRKDVPVTVTLKAETLMQFVVMSVRASAIPASEIEEIEKAITAKFGI